MDLLDLMQARYSVRSFSDRPVEDGKLNAILEAGRLAPTACNRQPQRVLVLRGDEPLARFRKCTKCHFNEQLVLVVCYDRRESWKRDYDGQDSGYVDASIVTTHMMLEASARGIGSTWIMYFDPDAVRNEFRLPDELEPVSVLAMGYASEQAVPSPLHSVRKDLSETVVYDAFPE